jgi:hypothetical protein
MAQGLGVRVGGALRPCRGTRTVRAVPEYADSLVRLLQNPAEMPSGG